MKRVLIKSKSPIFIGEYPYHQQLRDELVPLLEDYPDKQRRETNVKAKVTDWDWYSSNPRIDRLKKCLIEDVRNHFNYSCVGETPPLMHFKNFWGNIYSKGDHAVTHCHVPFYYSIVYFLKSKWYYSPLIFHPFGERIRPKEGTYVLFPSHLYHYVPPHRYKETRITLSGNLTFKE